MDKKNTYEVTQQDRQEWFEKCRQALEKNKDDKEEETILNPHLQSW